MIIEQGFLVHRLVELALVRVDADLAEERVHAERARLVGDDGDDVATDGGVLQQAAEQADEGHRGRGYRLAGAFEGVGEELELRHGQGRGVDDALREEAAEFLATLQQILRLRAVGRGPVEGHLGNLVVADGNLEALAELAELLLVHLLLVVGNVAALARLAEAVALDGLRENDRGRTLVLGRGFVGGVNLPRVVAAAHELAKLLVREVMHEREQFGILAEEMLPDVAARLDGVFLVVAVHRFFHALE